jgi:uncharacterized phage protein (TIGR01671 family)
MKRKIKFRVRNADTKTIIGFEWIDEDGNWKHQYIGDETIIDSVFDFIGNRNTKFQREQYTNLKDKNGKEIYEGDVYKTRIYSGTPGKFDRFIGVVKYITASYEVVGVKQYTGLSAELYRDYLVIGNIFENPELIKGDAKWK